MFIKWKIGKAELTQISLVEFEKEIDGVYGFMLLKLGDFQLGFWGDDCYLDEDIVDISWHIDMLIECGIALLKDQYFKKKFLDLNLLEIQAIWDKDVKIEIFHIKTKEKLCHYSIKFDELIAEIKTDYTKYINDIKEINDVILQSEILKGTKKLYDEFLDLLNQKVSN